MTHEDVVNKLMERGYRPSLVDLVSAANLILAGAPTYDILAVLEPGYYRAYQTRRWLDETVRPQLEQAR